MKQTQAPGEATLDLGEWIICGAAEDIYCWLRTCHGFLPPPLREEFEVELFDRTLSSAEQREKIERANPRWIRLRLKD